MMATLIGEKLYTRMMDPNSSDEEALTCIKKLRISGWTPVPEKPAHPTKYTIDGRAVSVDEIAEFARTKESEAHRLIKKLAKVRADLALAQSVIAVLAIAGISILVVVILSLATGS